MPVKTRYGPTFSWTGFNGGGPFGTSTSTFAGLASPSFKTSGGLAGGTIGFNDQTGPWALGVGA